MGTFSFYSYRDPNISKTRNAIDESVRHVIDGHFDAQDLEEAKLEVIQDLDAPISPGSRGITAYAWLRAGKSHAVRQAYRDAILRTTSDDVSRVSRERVAPGLADAPLISFANQALIERENTALTPPLAIKRI